MAAYRARVLRDLRRLAVDSAGLIPKRLVGPTTADMPAVADEMTLEQNIPNPFGHETSIPFTLKHSRKARLYITDQTGRHVLDILDRVMAQGAYSVPISIDELPSGVYYYHLELDGRRLTRQMSIVR